MLPILNNQAGQLQAQDRKNKPVFSKSQLEYICFLISILWNPFHFKNDRAKRSRNFSHFQILAHFWLC
jgi:hypothetical protein